MPENYVVPLSVLTHSRLVVARQIRNVLQPLRQTAGGRLVIEGFEEDIRALEAHMEQQSGHDPPDNRESRQNRKEAKPHHHSGNETNVQNDEPEQVETDEHRMVGALLDNALHRTNTSRGRDRSATPLVRNPNASRSRRSGSRSRHRKPPPPPKYRFRDGILAYIEEVVEWEIQRRMQEERKRQRRRRHSRHRRAREQLSERSASSEPAVSLEHASGVERVRVGGPAERQAERHWLDVEALEAAQEAERVGEMPGHWRDVEAHEAAQEAERTQGTRQSRHRAAGEARELGVNESAAGRLDVPRNVPLPPSPSPTLTSAFARSHVDSRRFGSPLLPHAGVLPMRAPQRSHQPSRIRLSLAREDPRPSSHTTVRERPESASSGGGSVRIPLSVAEERWGTTESHADSDSDSEDDTSEDIPSTVATAAEASRASSTTRREERPRITDDQRRAFYMLSRGNVSRN